ncbi:nucleolysin TIAR-like [Harpegnathos saltator]|uniref:nucleolysin TIAR-like n=1 Tax=Harpegnathos saltator TaxID=610380 RepID=UPI000DBEE699|nr:nucleolysin TIAR-like [Harpegnathos saltator]
MSADTTLRTLYIGNLDHAMSEDLLCALFSHIGAVTSCKIIREPRSDPYAFVEFAEHAAASAAVTALNQRLFLEKFRFAQASFDVVHAYPAILSDRLSPGHRTLFGNPSATFHTPQSPSSDSLQYVEQLFSCLENSNP